jgi:glyoxylase-like metal-dependent hydrolase (beta-lactamase superfamily II)
VTLCVKVCPRVCKPRYLLLFLCIKDTVFLPTSSQLPMFFSATFKFMSLELPDGLIFLERGWLSSNAIFLDDGEHTALIDSGYFVHSNLLMHFLELQLKDRALDVLVNTHLHSDHVGGNAALQSSFPMMQTWIPHGLFREVAAWDESALSFDLTGQSCPRFIANKALYPGDSFVLSGFEWEVHASPGHDHDALLFFNPEFRLLVSADALWINGFGVVFPEICGGTGFQEVSETLNLIENLNPLLVLPGHGPVIHDVAKSLDVARHKIDRFANNPSSHASHAAKVLLKFKLLELQTCSLDVFKQWALSTPLLIDIHRYFFFSTPLISWVDGLIHELVAKKVAMMDDSIILNC